MLTVRSHSYSKLRSHLDQLTASGSKLDKSTIEWIEVSLKVILVMGLATGGLMLIAFPSTLSGTDCSAASNISVRERQYALLADAAMIGAAKERSKKATCPESSQTDSASASRAKSGASH